MVQTIFLTLHSLPGAPQPSLYASVGTVAHLPWSIRTWRLILVSVRLMSLLTCPPQLPSEALSAQHSACYIVGAQQMFIEWNWFETTPERNPLQPPGLHRFPFPAYRLTSHRRRALYGRLEENHPATYVSRTIWDPLLRAHAKKWHKDYIKQVPSLLDFISFSEYGFLLKAPETVTSLSSC